MTDQAQQPVTEPVEITATQSRAERIAVLRTETHRLLAVEDHPPIQTLLNYALHALDEAQKWLGKQNIERTQPVMALVDLEIANAEGRLKIVIDLLELYGTDMGWND